MTVSQLLPGQAFQDFLEAHYLKLPFANAGGAAPFAELAGWSTIERLLTAPGVDLLIASQKLGRYQAAPPQTQAEAQSLLDQGYTLAFRRAHRHDAGLAQLAKQFATQFNAPIDVQLYCTPAEQAGFGWHYDAEEVFVLQSAGSKEWMLRKNTVNPWPLIDRLPHDMAYQRELMPLQRCLLHANDWLYIPAGYWHATKADEQSISLSVGVLAQSGVDFFDFLRNELCDDIRWRQRLPHLVQQADLQMRLAELAGDLARRITKPETAAHFVEALAGHGTSFAAGLDPQ